MNALTGTGGMVRLILRRDRLVLPILVLWLGLLPAGFVSATEQLYPTAAEQLQYARTPGATPTFLALYGPMYDPGLAGIVVQRAGFVPVVMAVVTVIVMIRHTRAEEEAGRRELLGATVLGRGAAVAAALLVTAGASLAAGLLLAAGMTAQGLPVAGSIAFGGQIAAAGCLFAAVAAVTAQLAQSAAAARGAALALLGAAFVVRMASDVGGTGNGLSWLGWLSPLGWVQRVRPYAAERWWLFALIAAGTGALAWAAARLAARRDLGAGIWPQRPGAADAPSWLAGPFGLAWRLHSRPLYGWLAAFAALGAVYGGVAGGIEDMLRDSPGLRDIFTRMGGQAGLLDAYFSSSMNVLGLIASAYAVSAALRLRSEEASLHAEPLLATPVGRLRWAASHLTFTLAGPAAAMTVGGLVAGLVHGLDTGRVGDVLPRVLGAATAQVPAVWVIAALSVALFGLLPHWTGLSWAAVAAAAGITLFGAVLDLGQWLLDLSPFTHIPVLGVRDVSPTPFLGLLALTTMLMVIGMAGFRRRDLALG
ncbi:ABC transporter permease [Thermomonospora cellulosilytica]|uniref:ABC-2 type transport system permease protein n=1 Tax=Thermomonospora cellulosilytica TaxID=1411118 RepID=A0A7W3N0B7_9ACTN|nr:ABC transporter permease [Thermomonospora cellulosilytica]MBA9005198.1 ABC-2 type transport system permease protein [Thermomonospora cellulosilytica]